MSDRIALRIAAPMSSPQSSSPQSADEERAAALGEARSVGDYRPRVADDWFIDPARRGVPGSPLRPAPDEDDNPLSWQTDSLCAQTDPEAFFPEKGGSTRDAKRICGQCEVRAQCLQYALDNDERFGIWGGLSERERRKLRKGRIA